MKFSFPITFKLLLFVFPFVCIPVAVVGYLAYSASVERVTRLSREQQLMHARVAAEHINGIFQSCRTDLITMARLPIMQDYQYAMAYSLENEVDSSKNKLRGVFQDFVSRFAYYKQIRIVDRNGRVSVNVIAEDERGCPYQKESSAASPKMDRDGDGICVSKVDRVGSPPCFVVCFSRSLQNTLAGYVGELVIDINYNKVMDVVKSIQIGERGYAFMVDHLGRMVAHPQFAPYEKDLSKYTDPRLRELVVDMMAGETGWMVYDYLGEKAAAYSPVPAMGWSIAVCVPIEEFKKEAGLFRKRMIEVVVVTLVLAGFGVLVMSHNLLRPIRRLVTATERIASGDLDQRIPVRSGDELGALTRSFNHMVRNLRDIQGELIRSEKLISMGRLSAGVAHEIRNPLNTMKGAIVHLQRRRPDDPLIREYTQLVLEEVDRLNHFVTEFLYFARQSAPTLVPTDLNDLIQHTLVLFEERLKETQVSIVKTLDPSLPLLPLDPHQMKQVIVNLILNAVDAMPEGGVLEVATGVETHNSAPLSLKTAVLEIRDHGVGIQEQDLNNVLDPFFSTKENGTGLGLPISQGIVESHEGTLTIRSRKGEGTTVTIVMNISGPHSSRELVDEKKNFDC